ncbi:DUF6282 family protein [Neobacillus sp. 114]|uniref:DUF6282 family protein n=1 Tax=Neobacillus sp. 114 TaxID=3048535 RepID=UPI0024C25511|nr:DUF6282 family protein [Neobacillus sp. 114]
MNGWKRPIHNDRFSLEVDHWIKIQPKAESISELLEGGIEFHAHSSPSVSKRKYSDIEYAMEARSCGMSGIVLKAHEGDTAARAQLVQEVVPEIRTIGGVVLNRYVGGFNADAVKMSHQLGGGIVWFPTVDADNHERFKATLTTDMASYEPGQYGGLTILDANGEVKREVERILEYVARHQLILASGHLSVPEIKALIPVLHQYQIRKFVIQHPDLHLINMSREDQMEVANEGFFLEKCLISFLPNHRVRSVAEILTDIKEVGHSHYLMVTDFGQHHHPSPIEGLNFFVHLLQSSGISSQQIVDMIRETPERLLSGKV